MGYRNDIFTPSRVKAQRGISGASEGTDELFAFRADLGRSFAEAVPALAAQRYACAAKGAEDACYSYAALFEVFCDSDGPACWTISHTAPDLIALDLLDTLGIG